MRLLTWNILHGGGPRRVPAIALALLEHNADAIVLTEWRRNRGGQLAAVLADHGWSHQIDSSPKPGQNGVLIASKPPALPDPSTAPTHHRLATLALAGGLNIVGLHVPPEPGSTANNTVWAHAMGLARKRQSLPTVIIGDFNAGKLKADGPCPASQRAQLGRLLSLGYVDAWRHIHPAASEHSWMDRTGRSSRVDLALVSAPLAGTITKAWHDPKPIELGLSDHAVLLIELDLSELDLLPRKQIHATPAGQAEQRAVPDHRPPAAIDGGLFT